MGAGWIFSGVVPYGEKAVRMDEVAQTNKTTKVGLAIATVGVVLAGAMVAFAWLYFDGGSVVAGLFSAQTQEPTADAVAVADESVADPVLELPAGMPESFALQVWQEQIDSQKNIRRLINGDFASLDLRSVGVQDDLATVQAEVVDTNGQWLPGTLRLRRIGERWFFADITAGGHVATGSGEAASPKIEDVDIDALNAIMAEHEVHKDLVGMIAAGEVKQIVVKNTTQGPNTATIAVDIVTDSGTSEGDLVALRSESDQAEVWVLARLVESEDATGQ